MKESEVLSPLQALANFSAAVETVNCPDSVVQKAHALLLYGIAVAVTSAGAEVPAKVARALRREYGSEAGSATCVTDGAHMPPGAAAFCNAVLFHVRIQDDAHPAGHMGTVILPALLALAEAQRSSGSTVLAAIISGYEVSLRIGRDHAADLSSRGFRTTPIYGALGAAAACARILELDTKSTMHALSLTVHAVAGLREFADAGTDEYPFQAGFAARNGLTGALLAAEGLIGTETALTGRAGLFPVYGDPSKDYAYRLLDKLGEHYEIEKVTYKPYPGGQFHRGVIRGFAELSANCERAAIKSAQVHMHPFEAGYLGLDFNGPFHTYAEAFFSVPFCAALAWLHGTVTFAALNRFADSRVLALVSRIHVVSDESVSRYKPFIRVTLEDGRALEWADDSGESGYDLTWEVAVSMTEKLGAEVGLPDRRVTELIAAVKGIDTMVDISPLLRTAAAVAAAISRPK